MIEFLLVIHLLICAAMIGVVLMQKSEGGALGIGGSGGGAGGFLTGRGTANLLTRTTALLAAAFFATSILLSILAGTGRAPSTPFATPAGGQTQGQPTSGAPTAPTGEAGAKPGGLLDSLRKGEGGKSLPSIPQNN